MPMKNLKLLTTLALSVAFTTFPSLACEDPEEEKFRQYGAAYPRTRVTHQQWSDYAHNTKNSFTAWSHFAGREPGRVITHQQWLDYLDYRYQNPDIRLTKEIWLEYIDYRQRNPVARVTREEWFDAKEAMRPKGEESRKRHHSQRLTVKVPKLPTLKHQVYFDDNGEPFAFKDEHGELTVFRPVPQGFTFESNTEGGVEFNPFMGSSTDSPHEKYNDDGSEYASSGNSSDQESVLCESDDSEATLTLEDGLSPHIDDSAPWEDGGSYATSLQLGTGTFNSAPFVGGLDPAQYPPLQRASGRRPSRLQRQNATFDLSRSLSCTAMAHDSEEEYGEGDGSDLGRDDSGDRDDEGRW